MMFEFREAAEHLEDGGIIASDDITWNATYDDFVRQNRFIDFGVKGHWFGLMEKPRKSAVA